MPLWMLFRIKWYLTTIAVAVKWLRRQLPHRSHRQIHVRTTTHQCCAMSSTSLVIYWAANCSTTLHRASGRLSSKCRDVHSVVLPWCDRGVLSLVFLRLDLVCLPWILLWAVIDQDALWQLCSFTYSHYPIVKTFIFSIRRLFLTWRMFVFCILMDAAVFYSIALCCNSYIQPGSCRVVWFLLWLCSGYGERLWTSESSMMLWSSSTAWWTALMRHWSHWTTSPL